MSIRVLFCNTPGRTPRRTLRDWWVKQAQDHDVMMSAEAAHLFTRRVGLLGTVHDHLRGWDAFAPSLDASNLAAIPIMWRSRRFRMVEAMPRFHYPSTRVGSWGAGPAWMKEGWTNAAKLLDKRTGEAWGLSVGHWAPSVQQTRQQVEKQGPEALHSWEERRRLHRLETEGAAGLLDDMAAQWSCPAVLCGDTNATPRFGGLEALRDVAEAIYPGPTHGNRAIDGFWLHDSAARSVKVTQARVIPGPLSDDHDAVSITLTST